MYATLVLFALVGYVAANPAILSRAEDDGQWHPESDGSAAGSGFLRWGIEDGSWKPDVDGSWLGRGDLAWLNRRRRDVGANSLSHPADEPVVAHAKNAQLRQQHTEAQRNILGGIPQDLPADTQEVADGKRAHAVAHENEKLATSAARYATPIHHVTRIATPVSRLYTPVAHVATPVHIATPVVARVVSPVAHVATPIAHVAAPVTHITTVARTVSPISPVGHIAYPVDRFATPVLQAVPPYDYAYTPVVQAYKK